MHGNTKPKRQYNLITPDQIAGLEALTTLLGNGSAAARALSPSVRNPGDRAWRIKKKAEKENTEVFIDTQLQVIGVDAVNRIGEIVSSNDEKNAMKASMYVVDHIRGQATKKSIALTGKINIQNVLD